MKLLLKAALLNRKHYFLLIVTVFAMFFLTLASQMEMFSLGVMAKTGPDFFTLFGKEKEGKLTSVPALSLEDVEQKWGKIAENGVVTQEGANAYIATHGGMSIVQKVNAFLDAKFHISNDLKKLALVLVFVAVFKAVSLFAHRYFTQLVAIRVSRDLRQKYFEHIQDMPLSFYHDYDIGSLSSRVGGDAGIVAQAINALLINYLQTPFAVLSTLLACFYISWQMSLVIFVGFPLIIVPIVIIARKIKVISKQMQRNQEGFASVLFDFLSGILTVKVFAMEEFSLKKYKEHNDRFAKLEERSARYGLASRPILHTISSLCFASVILAGLYIFRLSPSDLLVFVVFYMSFMSPSKNLLMKIRRFLRELLQRKECMKY